MSMQDACSPWPCASERWLLHHSIDRGTQSFISSICSAVADLIAAKADYSGSQVIYLCDAASSCASVRSSI
jgi:hypothetical protein